MKIIRNKFIPFKGFKAINLFGILFVRGNAYIGEKTIRHESIHTKQMKEMLYLPFYLSTFGMALSGLYVTLHGASRRRRTPTTTIPNT